MRPDPPEGKACKPLFPRYHMAENYSKEVRV
jgi:hypothetical protein